MSEVEGSPVSNPAKPDSPYFFCRRKSRQKVSTHFHHLGDCCKYLQRENTAISHFRYCCSALQQSCRDVSRGPPQAMSLARRVTSGLRPHSHQHQMLPPSSRPQWRDLVSHPHHSPQIPTVILSEVERSPYCFARSRPRPTTRTFCCQKVLDLKPGQGYTSWSAFVSSTTDATTRSAWIAVQAIQASLKQVTPPVGSCRA